MLSSLYYSEHLSEMSFSSQKKEKRKEKKKKSEMSICHLIERIYSQTFLLLDAPGSCD